MRLLFLFMLLLNLAFFAWMTNRQPSESNVIPIAEDQIKPLVLLREQQSAPRAPQATRPRATPTAGQSEENSPPVARSPESVASVAKTENLSIACYTFGPFASASEAATVAAKFSVAGVTPRQRVQETYEASGYWVYLPPYASRDRAVETTQKLARQGVRDYFIVTAAGKENAISLGVYKTRDSAERRRNEIAKLGYRPALDERYRTRFEYWLDYTLNEAIPALEDLYAEIRREHPEARPVADRCE